MRNALISDVLRDRPENEPKEDARFPRILRVVDTAGARGNSPAYRWAQTVRTLFSVRIDDARRRTKGMQPSTLKHPYILLGGYLRSTALL